MKYICTNCGYIYDPQRGEPMTGVDAGTSFEEIPENSVCPLCYLGKDVFDPLD